MCGPAWKRRRVGAGRGWQMEQKERMVLLELATSAGRHVGKAETQSGGDPACGPSANSLDS